MPAEDEKAILEAAYRERQPIPPKIQNAPELWLGLELYYGAFLDLTTCRFTDNGPISWLVMQEYADRKGLSDEQREDLEYHVAHMDKEYIKFSMKKAESKLKASAPPPKKPRAPARKMR